jgi:hypothetical protein
MLLNGKRFRIYVTDTYDTVIQRIAAENNTLPKYLKFTPPITSLEDMTGDIQMENLLTEIKNQTDIHFPQTLKTKITTDYPDLDLNKLEEIYIATNTELGDLDPEFVKPVLLTTKGFTIDINAAWDKRDRIIQDLEEELDGIKRLAQKEQDLALEFDSIPPISYTDFELEKIQYNLNFGPTRLTIEEIFNLTFCSDIIPYITLNNIYKVKNDFLPDKTWVELASQNLIVMKIDGEQAKQRRIKDVFKRYNTVVFGIINGELIATLTLRMGKRYVDKSNFTRRVIMALPNLDLDPVSSEEISVSGIYAYIAQNLDLVIWSELVMNDPLFNNLVVIDESVKASKIKQNIYLHILSSGNTASLQMKIGSKDFPLVPTGVPFVRVRVPKVKTIKDVKNIQRLIGKLFTAYNDGKYAETVAMYKKYIPSFTPTKIASTVKIHEELTPEDIAPEIFVAKYSRFCPKDAMPEIISEDEAKKTTLKTMKFPIKGESVERIYVCPNTKLPFPGLRENKLPNLDRFPFVPCCYARDHETKPGSRYRHYFYDEPLKQKSSQQQILTKKIVGPKVLGSLPFEIDSFFSTVTPPTHKFMRRGVNQTKMSLLEAVLTAKGIVNGTEPDIKQILERERNKISTLDYAAATKQELYNMSLEDILTSFKTNDLRATKYVRAIEEAFEYCIFIFEPGDEKGTLVIPEHTQCYYKLKPNTKTLFIYQHWGSESNVLEYPQCELIVRVKRDNLQKQDMLWDPESKVVQQVYKAFNLMTDKYKFSTQLPDLRIKKFPIVSQFIDAFGKLRVLNTRFRGKVLTLVVDPLPPFARPANAQIIREKTDIVFEMIEAYFFEPILQRKDETTGKIREVVVMIGSIPGTFLVDDTEEIPGVNTYPGEKYSALNGGPIISDIEIFDTNQKIAKQLIQYALFLVSEYMALQGVTTLTDELLKQFAKEMIVIDESITYNTHQFRPIFKHEANVIRGNKLVVPSKEIRNRIIFVIRLFRTRRSAELVTYNTLINIPEYYSDISNFTFYDMEYLLDGDDALTNLINDIQHPKGHATEFVQLEETRPYFFRNLSLGNKVFLAQNAKTYNQANYILYMWRTHGYNVGITGGVMAIPQQKQRKTDIWGESETETEEELQEEVGPPALLQELETAPVQHVSIYKYVNKDNIVNLVKNGRDILLAYKLNGISRYTVLFDI